MNDSESTNSNKMKNRFPVLSAKVPDSVVLVCVLIPFLILAMQYRLYYSQNSRHSARQATCQSHMTAIGRAMQMYLDDYDGVYPTNRPYIASGKLGPVAASVKLSHSFGDLSKGRKQPEFGVNWVEALNPYIAKGAHKDEFSNDTAYVWRCPVVSGWTEAANGSTAAVTYALNRNLVEKPRTVVKSTANLLVMREIDRVAGAELRPLNNSSDSQDNPPISPFLNSSDIQMGKTQGSLHGRGSHILFADGHVKFFLDTTYYPNKPEWDPETRQWYNFASSQNPTLDRSIAITP